VRHAPLLFTVGVPALHAFFSCFLLIRRPPRSTLFPYTTSSDLMVSFPAWDPIGLVNGLILALIVGLVSPIERFTIDSPRSPIGEDRKSTRLNSSHVKISYAVFCLKKKKQEIDGRARSGP